mgnify:CR=1 FL=1
MNLTRHTTTQAFRRNLVTDLRRVLDEGLAGKAVAYRLNGTRYLFFGRRFGTLEGLVLVTDPRTDTVITAYRNRDFPRWIKARLKNNNRHT